jgi:hypothetical protein
MIRALTRNPYVLVAVLIFAIRLAYAHVTIAGQCLPVPVVAAAVLGVVCAGGVVVFAWLMAGRSPYRMTGTVTA